jgi:two-component system, NarL family, response regulator NreC
MKVKILMVDDHPSMLDGYKMILSYNPFGYEVEVTVAYNCEQAYEIITKKRSANIYDLFFLDYSLPPYSKKKIENGRDLAVLAKKHFPEAKIVILTSHAEAILLYNIIRDINPDGILVKSDFTADELMVAFDIIVNDEKYYSQTVKQIVKEVATHSHYLGSINRQIILLISQGINTKSMPAHLKLSLSAIEKRKAFIKEYFNIKKGTDEDIIRIAKKQGLI